MKSGFARTMAAVLTGAAIAVSTSGIAAASSLTDEGNGSVATQSAAHQLLDLRDQLATKAYSGDVQGTERALDSMTPVLDKLTTADTERAHVTEAKDALAQNQQVQEVLADPSAKPQTYAMSAEARQLPELPDPLTMVNGLLQSLLATVGGLLDGLLGGGAVPDVPVPDVPEAPVPEVPEAPVPAPDLP
ncbi:hypothetical protein BJF85_24360 [Saccharomonospora sp. CUA-673]|uniref:hypothetical protein n=1 Tax=Saccharomonospora sp. CUA-673 TaxID=1904969 RepID=UPI00095FA2E8|nr:hypothetical protein [Saccharomonospora sp. CUA-673]OLT41212.1 hypothetical protein BJF85_24360 [Saccharomonospora sp. CUA-673]